MVYISIYIYIHINVLICAKRYMRFLEQTVPPKKTVKTKKMLPERSLPFANHCFIISLPYILCIIKYIYIYIKHHQIYIYIYNIIPLNKCHGKTTILQGTDEEPHVHIDQSRLTGQHDLEARIN